MYDFAAERTWRHLDTMQFQTIIRARAPRVNCPTHGVKTVVVPWAEPHGRFSRLFERFAIDVLFVDKQGRVTRVVHTLRPWRITGSFRGFATIELPAGTALQTVTRAGHQLTLV